MGTSDLMEDMKFTGGIRIAPNLRDNDVLFEFPNLRKRIGLGSFILSQQQHEISFTRCAAISRQTIFKLLPRPVKISA